MQYEFLGQLVLQLAEMHIETLMTVQKLPEKEAQSSVIGSIPKMIHCLDSFVVRRGGYHAMMYWAIYFSDWQRYR
jgi:hypothetical protein